MKVKSISLAAVALLASFASNASAEMHAMPGTSCTLWSGTDGVPYFGNPRLYNMSTSYPLTGLCAIDVDGAASLSSPVVKVIDNNPNADASCTLVVHTLDGSSFATSWGSTSGNSSSVKPISLSSLSMPAGGGTATFVCDVPPRWGGLDSAIVSYKVN